MDFEIGKTKLIIPDQKLIDSFGLPKICKIMPNLSHAYLIIFVIDTHKIINRKSVYA
jgi:hypothetical protein